MPSNEGHVDESGIPDQKKSHTDFAADDDKKRPRDDDDSEFAGDEESGDNQHRAEPIEISSRLIDSSPRRVRRRRPRMELLALVANCAGNGDNKSIQLIGDVRLPGGAIYSNFVEHLEDSEISCDSFNVICDENRHDLESDYPLPECIRGRGITLDIHDDTWDEFIEQLKLWIWRFYIRLTRSMAPDLVERVTGLAPVGSLREEEIDSDG